MRIFFTTIFLVMGFLSLSIQSVYAGCTTYHYTCNQEQGCFLFKHRKRSFLGCRNGSSSTKKQINISPFSGEYTGLWTTTSGESESGIWLVTVNSFGVISGSLNDGASISGSVGTSGTMNMPASGGTSDGASFRGVTIIGT